MDNNFLNSISVNTGSFWGDININALILSAIVISVPVLIAILIPIFKAKLGLKSSLFLYSFTTGFFIVLGLFGEANEGRELAMNSYTGNDAWVTIGNQILVLLVGSIIGLVFATSFKFLISRKLGKLNLKGPVEDHSDHVAFHNHPHAEEVLFGGKGLKYQSQKEMARAKAVAIYLVLSHRFAAGFFLGYVIYNIVSPNYPGVHEAGIDLTHSNHDNVNLAFLIGFFLHLIPEELIIYYRQREIGIGKVRAAVYSVLMVGVLIPFIFLGANLGIFVSDVWQLNGIIHVIVGVLFTFTALIEFFPEVIREAKNQKLWYLTITCLALGIILCFFVLSFGA